MNLKIKGMSYLFVILFFSVGTLSANESSHEYSMGLEDVVGEAKISSRILESLRKKHRAAEELLSSEKAYYYPKVSLAGNLKDHYGDDTANPDFDKEGDVSLKVEAKIYGDATNDKIEAAQNVERSAFYDVKSKENEIYYLVLSALSKIERTRRYIQDAKILRVEMMDYLDSLKTAIKEGVSPASDLKKAELSVARFDDVIFAENSNIERYFYELKTATEVEIVNPDNVGIPLLLLNTLSDASSTNFEQDDAILNNVSVLSKEFYVKSLKYGALSQTEDVKLSIVNETYMDVIEDRSSGVLPRKVHGESYIGLRLDVKLFDYQKDRSDTASFLHYLAGSDALEDEKQKIRSEVELLDRNYKSTMSKRQNALEQMKLSRDLAESQKNDLWIDRVTYQDVIETLFSYNQSARSLLQLDLQAYTEIYTYWELKSELIF